MSKILDYEVMEVLLDGNLCTPRIIKADSPILAAELTAIRSFHPAYENPHRQRLFEVTGHGRFYVTMSISTMRNLWQEFCDSWRWIGCLMAKDTPPSPMAIEGWVERNRDWVSKWQQETL